MTTTNAKILGIPLAAILAVIIAIYYIIAIKKSRLEIKKLEQEM